jgi:U3 small nucleolar RNA-associated protein 19
VRRTLLGSYAPTTHPHAATNLLALLERLATFPTAQKELNEWWIAEFGAKPPKPASAGGDASDASDDEATPAVPADADEDWRTFFDTDDAPAAPGKAAKPGHARAPAAKKPAARPRGTHRSLHALGAHRAVFTRAWLALLPALGDDARAARALAVLHRAVLPHLTRPVLVMDWVASCVDRGNAFRSA